MKESAGRATRRAAELLIKTRREFLIEMRAKNAVPDLSTKELDECWDTAVVWFLVTSAQIEAGEMLELPLSAEEWRKALEESDRRHQELWSLFRSGEGV